MKLLPFQYLKSLNPKTGEKEYVSIQRLAIRYDEIQNQGGIILPEGNLFQWLNKYQRDGDFVNIDVHIRPKTATITASSDERFYPVGTRVAVSHTTSGTDAAKYGDFLPSGETVISELDLHGVIRKDGIEAVGEYVILLPIPEKIPAIMISPEIKDEKHLGVVASVGYDANFCLNNEIQKGDTVLFAMAKDMKITQFYADGIRYFEMREKYIIGKNIHQFSEEELNERYNGKHEAERQINTALSKTKFHTEGLHKETVHHIQDENYRNKRGRSTRTNKFYLNGI